MIQEQLYLSEQSHAMLQLIPSHLQILACPMISLSSVRPFTHVPNLHCLAESWRNLPPVKRSYPLLQNSLTTTQKRRSSPTPSHMNERSLFLSFYVSYLGVHNLTSWLACNLSYVSRRTVGPSLTRSTGRHHHDHDDAEQQYRVSSTSVLGWRLAALRTALPRL